MKPADLLEAGLRMGLAVLVPLARGEYTRVSALRVSDILGAELRTSAAKAEADRRAREKFGDDGE